MAGPIQHENPRRVEFTQRQIDYLDKQFPELIGTVNTSADELRWRAAQRSVIAAIKGWITKKERTSG